MMKRSLPPNCSSWAWPPRVQVAGVSTLHEALFCKRVGVDALGFTLGLPTGSHDDLTPEKAREIILQLTPEVLPVLITYIDTAPDASSLALQLGARAVQFHGNITDSEVRVFRHACPHVKTIGRVTVVNEKSIAAAASYQPPLWDAIILDSFDPATGRTGATGRTHDWTISAQIAAVSKVPVILAGGLTPENVAQAIAMVRPSGVDAHTGLENIDGTRSFFKIRRFAEAALEAFHDMSR